MKHSVMLWRFQSHTISMTMTNFTTTDGTRPFYKRFNTAVLRFIRA